MFRKYNQGLRRIFDSDVDFRTKAELGDINGDGNVNQIDVEPFVALLVAGRFQTAADINCDGAVDLLDVGAFVDLLVGG